VPSRHSESSIRLAQFDQFLLQQSVHLSVHQSDPCFHASWRFAEALTVKVSGLLTRVSLCHLLNPTRLMTGINQGAVNEGVNQGLATQTARPLASPSHTKDAALIHKVSA